MTLQNANVIVSPDQDTVIETAFGKVEIGARSTVLIMALPTGTAVYNLDDTRKNSVGLMIGKNYLAVAPGRHAMVTTHLVAGFEMINPAESFAYRNVSSKKLDGELQIFTSEFSIINAINNIKQLRDLVGSKHSEARRLVCHLLKTAAIVSQISAGGEYHQYQHPCMTATAMLK